MWLRGRTGRAQGADSGTSLLESTGVDSTGTHSRECKLPMWLGGNKPFLCRASTLASLPDQIPGEDGSPLQRPGAGCIAESSSRSPGYAVKVVLGQKGLSPRVGGRRPALAAAVASEEVEPQGGGMVLVRVGGSRKRGPGCYLDNPGLPRLLAAA
ncbi:hypothetical protein mRhiFer1_009716 [Rhinolophus ferrumequinum]|uniref:Uncharacterized protein n=1 Tax=Rhinolophus ferrumequinum TaxID=59479 RepID=A0A7J7QY57_RHIFE|nr:hypothetical protein mRhiFer1_009716 [Rhinolophus ferrumequinum]